MVTHDVEEALLLADTVAVMTANRERSRRWKASICRATVRRYVRRSSIHRTEDEPVGVAPGRDGSEGWFAVIDVARQDAASERRSLGSVNLRDLTGWLIPLFLLALTIVIWETWVWIDDTPAWFLPAPSAIVAKTYASRGLLWERPGRRFRRSCWAI